MTINEKLDAMDKKLDIIQDLLNNVATKDDLKDEVEEIKEKSHESSQDLIFLIFLIVLIVIH